jgi:hypothetical protein
MEKQPKIVWLLKEAPARPVVFLQTGCRVVLQTGYPLGVLG